MKTIYLLSCCKQKLAVPAKAQDLYQSTGFKKSLKYALSMKPDGIYVLSAKHHIVQLNSLLEPYDECLSFKTQDEQKAWAIDCIVSLSKHFNLKKDKFVILAGYDYYKNLIGLGRIENYELPLKGLSQGYRLQWFDENTRSINKLNLTRQEELCDSIHKYVNELKRYSYPFNPSELPENGIYICFEKGETYKEWDRVVRVGTCTGENNLQSRLAQHFFSKNKDRSIFIKNIGRALLNKRNDSFLNYWNVDLTTRAAKETYSRIIDLDKVHEIEDQASQYIRENITFAVLPIEKKEERLSYEKFLISTISSCKVCKASSSWLGNYSSEEKIRSSGMWLKQGLSNSYSINKQPEIGIRNISKLNPDNFTKIFNFLDLKKQTFCDDCLSLSVGVYPRQQVNQICNLRHRNLIHSKYGKCSNCGKQKLIRYTFK